MPAKKGGNTDIVGTSTAQNEHASISPPLSESSDPVVQAVGIVDRKVRNLEKRKVSAHVTVHIGVYQLCLR